MTRYALFGATMFLLGTMLALPLVTAGDAHHEHWIGEEVRIEKPYSEVISRVPAAIREAGLVKVADIDWARFSAEPPASPAVPRLDEEGSTKLHTYICETEGCIKMIGGSAEHALKLPARFVVYEKDGKTCILYTTPAAHLVEHVKHGGEVPDKIREHHQDLEMKLEKVIEILKG